MATKCNGRTYNPKTHRSSSCKKAPIDGIRCADHARDAAEHKERADAARAAAGSSAADRVTRATVRQMLADWSALTDAQRAEALAVAARRCA